MLDASLIIPTRNRAEILTECLARLCRQDISTDRFEVIVLDDDSSDHTGEVLKRMGCEMPNLSWQRYTRTDNISTAYIAKLRNTASERANGRILISIDDDCLVPPGFVSGHVSRHDRSAGQIVTGPIIDTDALPPDEMPTPAWRKGFHTNPIPGGNFSILRHTFRQVGGFDENFNHYGWEDMELYERLKALGVRRHFQPSLPVFHYKPHTNDSDYAKLIRREIHRGAMGAYFYRKHPRLPVALETKQLAPIRWLDAALNRLLDLDGKIAEVLKHRYRPSFALMRALLREHAEISGDRLLHLTNETHP